MATILLTAVGTALGGPLGGALGALAGQALDTSLFAPKPRQGPRLADLSVQTSQYGNAVPAVHGTMRVAGTVIWATDLREHSDTTGGGKGQPAATSYSYSVSLAIALSSRPIHSVGRIWADGNLLRGAAGDFKSAATLRVHSGRGDQEPDPLIASAEGAHAPAHRGMACAVLEDFDLAPFGNRIPSLTFEVVADPGPVTLADMVRRHAPGVAVTAVQPLHGLALAEATLAESLANIAAAIPLACTASGGDLALAERGVSESPGAVATLPPALAPGPGDTAAQAAGPVRARSGDSRLSGPVELRYHDVARDFQSSLQRAGPAARDGRVARTDFPASLDTAQAGAIAAALAASRHRSAETVTLDIAAVDPSHLPHAPVRVENTPGLWQTRNWQWSSSGVTLSLGRHGTPVGPASGNSGRAVQEADYPAMPSIVALADLPALNTALNTGTSRPHVVLAACGDGPGWRGGEPYVEEAGGALTPAGFRLTRAAAICTSQTALPAASAHLPDIASSAEIRLFDSLQPLAEADDVALAQGANLALLGDELVQFGHAEALGSGHYRIAGLLRGRGGTAAMAHEPGERFLLLDDRAHRIDLSGRPNFAALAMVVAGRGDAEPVRGDLAFTGRALVPHPPVHLRARPDGSGGLECGWIARVRGNWIWADGHEQADPDGAAAYIATLSHHGETLAQENVAGTGWTVPASALAGLTLPATLVLSVRRTGMFAASQPATATFALSA